MPELKVQDREGGAVKEGQSFERRLGRFLKRWGLELTGYYMRALFWYLQEVRQKSVVG